MRGLTVSLLVGILFASASLAQQRKHYIIEDNHDFDYLDFTLNATSGSYQISPTHNPNPINIYGNLAEGAIEPEFTSRLDQRTNYVSFNLQEDQDRDISKTISFNVFSKNESEDEQWMVYLSQSKPLCLNLNYGIGDAMIDLSGVPIQKLKINTGSADVTVEYSGQANKVDMDTFYVKVDLGSVTVKRADFARAKIIIAEVGFGDLSLDFSKVTAIKSEVIASVGAGNLEILIPKTEAPIKIILNDSPLCRVKLAKSFEEVEENVYVNKSYLPDSENLLTFNLDVAMGYIVFKEKK